MKTSQIIWKMSLLGVLLSFFAAGTVNPGTNREITGSVTDQSTGAPVAEAMVVLKGTAIHTVTDKAGEYVIVVPGSESVLIFNRQGYAQVEKVVGNRAVIDVSLTPINPHPLDEVAEEDSFYSIPMGRTMEKRSNASADFALSGYPAPASVLPDHDRGYFNTDEYDVINENIFHEATRNPLSTFSIDVDAASYSNLRRVINNGQVPAPDMVRVEEMVNYFTYDYDDPRGDQPFNINTEVGPAPWNEKHRLVHIGLQGKQLDYNELKPSNLVFLVDVSGSMSAPNKLPLLKSSLKLLVNELGKQDKVAIVAYAGAAGLVLPSTPATEKSKIITALDRLQSGGSTAGGEGILLAYKVAQEHLIEEGNNRVILATDGDFNVGVSSTSNLVRIIEEKRKSDIYLTIMGLGMGNYKDGRMEQISNAGNGNYYYIDNIKEARKVFVTDLRATLFTIAKDVKIQVEFNPNTVQAYRLIGYENRVMKNEDFNDDQKDAGELGAGHTVTALYEIIPVGVESEFIKDIDELKYQQTTHSNAANTKELLTVKFRYKRPKEQTSRLITQVVRDKNHSLDDTSDNYRWSAAVASFGMLLRDSEFKGNASYSQTLALALGAQGEDEMGYRSEFIDMVRSMDLLALR